MGFLRKIAAAAVAGVLCFVGTGALPESALMPQEHVLRQVGKPFRKRNIIKKAAALNQDQAIMEMLVGNLLLDM